MVFLEQETPLPLCRKRKFSKGHLKHRHGESNLAKGKQTIKTSTNKHQKRTYQTEWNSKQVLLVEMEQQALEEKRRPANQTRTKGMKGAEEKGELGVNDKKNGKRKRQELWRRRIKGSGEK